MEFRDYKFDFMFAPKSQSDVGIHCRYNRDISCFYAPVGDGDHLVDYT